MLKVKGGEPLPKEDIIATPSFGLNYTFFGVNPREENLHWRFILRLRLREEDMRHT